MKSEKSHFQLIKDLYVKSYEKSLSLQSLQDLDEFYQWFFDYYKQFSIKRLWHTPEWKQMRESLLFFHHKCIKCGSDQNLVVQHKRPWVRFGFFDPFYNRCSFYSWQKYRKLRNK